jgi:hypothetical protein
MNHEKQRVHPGEMTVMLITGTATRIQTHEVEKVPT